jgi:hypothetical protein
VRRLAALAIVALAVSGCSLLPDLGQGPRACIDAYSANRCLAMTDVAAADVSKNRGDVVGIVIVPDPPPDGATLGGASPIHVRVAFRDGTTHDARMCGGIPWGPACSDEPSLSPRSALGAYTDVPAGSTPVPSPQPEAKEAATSIVIDTLTIPIERQGSYEIVVGRGSLPNGRWTIGSFDFADPWPDDVAIREGYVTLELRSLEPDGKPFDNYYLHGWREGVERVEAVLMFDVLWFESGAELTIQNVVVR